MTAAVRKEQSELLRHAAARAGLAPSVHNTQPWRFRLTENRLELAADRERQLRVLDPTGRHLMIGCGSALFNARVALAAARREIAVERFPDGESTDLLARITLSDRTAPWTPLVRLEPAIELRHTNRRDFFDKDVPEEIEYELVTAASAEDVTAFAVHTEEHRRVVAGLVREADEIQADSPAYLAELRSWTTEMGKRPDGITARSYPKSTSTRAEVPIRDFDAGISGQMAPVLDSSRDQCLLILGTAQDTPLAWLRTGEALQRLWLEATRLDYVASPITQVIEVEAIRDRLRIALDLPVHPHILMRVGQAAPNITTNRRPLDQMVDDVDN